MSKLLLILITLTGLVIAYFKLKKPVETKSSVNTSEKTNFLNGFELRPDDDYGSGKFGASRKRTLLSGEVVKYSHRGLDVSYQPFSPLPAPFKGYINRLGYVYEGNDELRLIEFIGVGLFSGYKMKMMYASVQSGFSKLKVYNQYETIGYVQNMKKNYSKNMTNHVHYELYDPSGKLINPEKYV
ncbi:hypothetical protein N7U66_01975 [Lacinutrix neustonica]|uniref:Peptidase M23 n=1 Tax=Lacinutrix neustonica TaxID=2980107 RepID=A0A9E8MYB1_9FLAO|nr:hypothetical protein [Lacinutrix neustonica]WAC02504.1 hypothetical protein N7U66_01975 [Lacinutrix neustonica]